jgi:CubicO group peptidase (beta-lactamase class C family)
MLLYIRANADSTSQPLGSVLAATHRQQRPGPTHTISVGLSWHRLVTRSGRTLVWHNGGTGGYRTFVGFDEASGLGVVVFANTAVSVDDIGMHLLDGSVPLTPIPRRRVATWVAPEILERYVGEYEVGPAFAITITREGSTLYAQATAQQRYPIFAETDSAFFFRVADAQLTFTKDPAGTVIGLVLHQNGESIPGRKK